jgi:hypothetical protein
MAAASVKSVDAIRDEEDYFRIADDTGVIAWLCPASATSHSEPTLAGCADRGTKGLQSSWVLEAGVCVIRSNLGRWPYLQQAIFVQTCQTCKGRFLTQCAIVSH